ncbi:medium-chain acyl-CoA ligase ACSF2, mitochondrial-like [Chrysoperla carnea]|uniref:medium-chain acyl-CoA ligase ACSF2, mitochondrial-like n=1 Tax=Chrysoperla carnea TaxID=189513 RepID=UPI001D073FC0|nr:medium-chain acyl-CoA ligase ACSF2, mitochondrial-like [Chrysoperla carnea]
MVNFKFNNISLFLSVQRQLNLQYRKCHKSTKKGSYIHQVGKHPLVYKTVGNLVDEAAERFPNRNAYVLCEENKKITFHSLKEETDKLAAGLLAIGFKKSDKLAIWGPNSLNWLISLLATAKIGVISVLINPLYELPELEYSLRKTNVSGIITPESFRSHNYLGMINDLNPKIPRVIISSEKQLPGVLRFDDVLEMGNKYKKEDLITSKNSVLSDDGFCIQLSSGTTGKPKAALLSHNNYVNNSYTLARHLQYDENYKFCLQTPLFHVFATHVIAFPALISGSTVVIPSKSYDPLKALKTIESEKCTEINGTPTMFVDLIKLQEKHKFNLSSLERAICGAAPCSPSLFKDMKTKLGIKHIIPGYGMTETSGAIFMGFPNDTEFNSIETIGRLAEHVEAKVVDDKGKLVPFGSPGELHIRGNCTMLEYYGDEEKTKEAKGHDGWLKTGDQAILFENGYAQIVGRLKDMIIRGGENIFPKEIEDFLNTHPKIIESQVFGVPDERMGEEVMVCLRVHENTTITIDEIKEYSLGKLSKFKIPKYIRIVQEFPKTSTGKIHKINLREQILKNWKI